MRRWHTETVVCLALGLFLNVGICWQAALWPVQTRINHDLFHRDYNSWISKVELDPNPLVIETSSEVAFNRTAFIQYSFDAEWTKESGFPREDWNYLLYHDSYGWPLRAMSYDIVLHSVDGRNGVAEQVTLGLYRSGIQTGFANRSVDDPGNFLAEDGQVHLPLRIHPSGFLTNWGILFCIIITPTLLYRARKKYITQRRLEKGLCGKCGYTLANLKTCPECGTSAKPRRMQA